MFSSKSLDLQAQLSVLMADARVHDHVIPGDPREFALKSRHKILLLGLESGPQHGRGIGCACALKRILFHILTSKINHKDVKSHLTSWVFKVSRLQVPCHQEHAGRPCQPVKLSFRVWDGLGLVQRPITNRDKKLEDDVTIAAYSLLLEP